MHFGLRLRMEWKLINKSARVLTVNSLDCSDLLVQTFHLGSSVFFIISLCWAIGAYITVGLLYVFGVHLQYDSKWMYLYICIIRTRTCEPAYIFITHESCMTQVISARTTPDLSLREFSHVISNYMSLDGHQTINLNRSHNLMRCNKRFIS